MGLTGAAVATSIGRGTGVVYQLVRLHRPGSRIRLSARTWGFDLQVMTRLIRVSFGGVLQFLIETTFITTLGGVFGLVLGFLGTQGLSMMMGGHAVVPIPAMLLGLLFSAVVGLAAGLIPARRAAALEPVETLR